MVSRRGEKRERAAYHDSRRYLKRHPPRLSDPLFGLRDRKEWRDAVGQAIQRYPRQARRREADLRSGGLGRMRKGPSAESVVLRHSGGAVCAVEMALERFPAREQRRLRAVLWGGGERRREDKPLVALFCRYVAAYLGYGRERYDIKSS